MVSKMCKVNILNKTECIEIVQKSKKSENVKIIDYQIENASDDIIGFIGQYFRLIVNILNENEETEQLKFFIKALPINLSQRKYVEETGMFEKEVLLYNNLLDEINKYSKSKWKPECYLARSDILVLEDLYQAGYYIKEGKFNFTIDHMKAILTNLAVMHASSISFEVNTKINIGENFKEILSETSVGKEIEWFSVGLRAIQAVATIHPKYNTIKYQKFISNEFFNKIQPVYEMVNPSKTYRNVLCHRDVWGKNILFKNGSNNSLSSVFVDFQTCRYCPPAIDVLFMIYLNTRRNFRDLILNESLLFYYQQLKNELNKMNLDINDYLTLESFLESCDHMKLLLILYNSIAATVIHLRGDILQDMRRNEPTQYYNFANINRNEVILENVKTDEKFRDILFEAIEELMEVIYDDDSLDTNNNMNSIK